MKVWKHFADPQISSPVTTLEPQTTSCNIYPYYLFRFFSMDFSATRSWLQLIIIPANVRVIYGSIPSKYYLPNYNQRNKPSSEFLSKDTGATQGMMLRMLPSYHLHSLGHLALWLIPQVPPLAHMACPSGKWSFIIRVLIFKISLCIRLPWHK